MVLSGLIEHRRTRAFICHWRLLAPHRGATRTGFDDPVSVILRGLDRPDVARPGEERAANESRACLREVRGRTSPLAWIPDAAPILGSLRH